MCLCTAPIFDWYKQNNIYYTIPFIDVVISECKLYIIKSKQGKNYLYPLTKTDPCVCPPAIDPYIFSQSANGLFIGYSSFTKVIIYFDP